MIVREGKVRTPGNPTPLIVRVELSGDFLRDARRYPGFVHDETDRILVRSVGEAVLLALEIEASK